MRPPPSDPCRRPMVGIALFLTVLTLTAIAIACGIGSGSKPSRSFQPFPDDSPTPPAGLPLDLDAADKLRHDGDIEGALAIYQAVAQRQTSSDPAWVRAVRSAAQTYFQEGDFGPAADVASVLLEADPLPVERQRALLLLGAARQEAGDAEAAADALRDYIDEGGAATAQARIRLASALSAQGEDEEAVTQIETALTEGLPPDRQVDALFTLARAYEAEDRAEDALTTWQRAADQAETVPDRGEALWFLALAARKAGEDGRYQSALVTLAREYPWHERALEAISQPQRAPSPSLSGVERGVVLFNQGQDGSAAETFREALQEDAITALEEGRAHLFLALLSERAGEPEEALTEYDAALEALTGLEDEILYGEVAWERAVLLEAMERIDDAVAGYAALADASPESDRAPEALFRAGLVRFRQGVAGEADSVWSRYLEIAEGEDVARAHFWLAKVNVVLGDTAAANSHLEQAAEASAWDYFGMRAAAILEGGEPIPADEPAPEPAEPDWSVVESWLESWTGPEDPETSSELSELPAWRRGLELLQAGLVDEAGEEFQALLADFTGKPWPLLRLARGLYEQGQTALAARAAGRLAGERADAPPDVLRVAYPNEYNDLVEAEASENGFPPLLMLALVRQESFFEADAQSSAGALGLTQVIPSTAEAIAEQLGDDDFNFGDLRRPIVSLRFGAFYLAEQLELFEGDIPAALAAYNGGPGNSLQWRDLAPGDPDLFLETIWFSETRAYVELVLEHYARYRFAYGLADGPALPL